MNNRLSCKHATAIISGKNDYSNLRGRVYFYQKKNYVLVEAKISGLPKSDTGFFGFHIHQGNNCGGYVFENTKGHYNPYSTPHPSHAGDLPPLILSDGGAYLAFTTNRFCVSDIIGRTVVIHSSPDDFNTQPAGNAGAKIACGIITGI